MHLKHPNQDHQVRVSRDSQLLTHDGAFGLMLHRWHLQITLDSCATLNLVHSTAWCLRQSIVFNTCSSSRSASFRNSLRLFPLQGIENTGSMWIDAGDSWAARSSWDSTISGEATVCVYNSSDPFDNACGEVRASFNVYPARNNRSQEVYQSTPSVVANTLYIAPPAY